VLAASRRQLDQFVALEPKVLKGNKPEAIHDIRVASRRLQQVLDLLYLPPRPAKVRKLRSTIRRARRVLSDLRNCDVLLERVERVLGRKRASRREAWEAFRGYLQQRREQSFRKASRELSKLNLSALYVRLREHLKLSGQPSARLAPQSAPAAIPMGDRDDLLRARLDAALRETWSSLETLIAQAREAPEATALHAVRIGAKKVRYLMEVIHELDVPGSDRALSSLRHLQQHLGDWHDLQVLEEMMLEMVARPRFLQGNLELAMEVERLALRNRRRKGIHEERLFQMTGNSEEWKRLTEWIQGFLSGDSLPAGGEGEELHSQALPLKA
jgi:CHAD domain-containing protein